MGLIRTFSRERICCLCLSSSIWHFFCNAPRSSSRRNTLSSDETFLIPDPEWPPRESSGWPAGFRSDLDGREKAGDRTVEEGQCFECHLTQRADRVKDPFQLPILRTWTQQLNLGVQQFAYSPPDLMCLEDLSMLIIARLLHTVQYML